jgi:hypothetical protein
VPGFGALLQRPLPGPVTEREDTAISRVRQAHHHVNRQGWQWDHHLQPRSRRNLGHTTNRRATTAHRKNYTLRTPCRFPCSLQQLSDHLRGVWGDVGTAHIESSAAATRHFWHNNCSHRCETFAAMQRRNIPVSMELHQYNTVTEQYIQALSPQSDQNYLRWTNTGITSAYPETA